MNIFISDVNLCSLEELNSIFASILVKGHGKLKNNSKSYRSICKCPVLAWALDSYVGDQYGVGWQAAQSPGSSHNLAALLLTETIQHCVYVFKQPVYAIFLDAKSCFDQILFKSVIREAYLTGMKEDQGLILINNRLKNRVTYCEFDNIVMGPIA